MELDWDEHNLFHIAQHGVTRDEVESALRGGTVYVKTEVRNHEERTSKIGQALNGRILFIGSVPRSGRIRVVTAFAANKRFRETYLSRKGSRTQPWLN